MLFRNLSQRYEVLLNCTYILEYFNMNFLRKWNELKDLEEEVSFNVTIKCVQKLGLDLALSLGFTVFAMGVCRFFKKFHLSFCP